MHAVFSAYIKTPLFIMLGGFSSGYYWSSTENDNNNAWKQNFNNGSQHNYDTDDSDDVRAVRAF
jgi:hypothetical protein